MSKSAWVAGYSVSVSSTVQPKTTLAELSLGRLTGDGQIFEGVPVKADGRSSRCIAMRVGLILARDLPGDSCTPDDVWWATAALAPAMEVIDAHVEDGAVAGAGSIPGGAASAGWLLGEKRVSPRDLHTGSIDTTLTRNGEVVATGRTDALLERSLTVIARVSRRVQHGSVQLRAGDVVLVGGELPASRVRAGDHFVADFSVWGSIRLNFG
jgi:2-keto-4-pentenoate hydratase